MGLVNTIMGVMVAIIIGVGVAIPVTNQVISDGNLTGTDATLAGFVSTLIVAAIIYGLIQYF